MSIRRFPHASEPRNARCAAGTSESLSPVDEEPTRTKLDYVLDGIAVIELALLAGLLWIVLISMGEPLI